MVSLLLKLILIVPVFTVLVSCSSGTSSVEFGSQVDYLKTKLVVLGSGIANGSSYLYVEVHSMNDNGTVNPSWVPELSIASGSGAVVQNCNPTDEQGVARCAITSTVPGIKTVNIDNAFGVVVQEDVEFTMPVLSLSVISNVPGSNIINTSGGYSISASLSNMKAPLRFEDSSGTKVYSTVQGIVLSDDY